MTIHIGGGFGGGGGGGGSGDVVGPASSIDNGIPVFDGITGKLLKQSSTATLIDANFLITAGLGSDATFALADDDIAHGITSVQPTNQVLKIGPVGSFQGGALLTAISAGDSTPLQIQSFFGTNNPTNTIPAISYVVGKKIGAFVQPLNDDETAFDVFNYSTQVFRVMGNGNAVWGPGTPLFPLHLFRAPQNGALVGFAPPSLISGDAIFNASLPALTGFVYGFNFQGPITTGIISRLQNTSAVATANAVNQLITSAAGGDPKNIFTINGVKDVAFGIDRSTAQVVLAMSDTLGSFDALRVDYTTGNAQWQNRSLGKAGASLTISGDLTLGNDGNKFRITGTGTINRIATAGWTDGSRIILKFALAGCTVTDGVAAGGGFGTINVTGPLNYTSTVESELHLTFDGTSWYATPGYAP